MSRNYLCHFTPSAEDISLFSRGFRNCYSGIVFKGICTNHLFANLEGDKVFVGLERAIHCDIASRHRFRHLTPSAEGIALLDGSFGHADRCATGYRVGFEHLVIDKVRYGITGW